MSGLSIEIYVQQLNCLEVVYIYIYLYIANGIRMANFSSECKSGLKQKLGEERIRRKGSSCHDLSDERTEKEHTPPKELFDRQ